MTGILHDREAAKMAIAELKGTGFTDESILIVSDAKSAARGDSGTSYSGGATGGLARASIWVKS